MRLKKEYTSKTMKEVCGDLFELSKGGVLVITTNGFVKNNGEAVMGRGCARQAAQRWPDMPSRLGQGLKANGNIVMITWGGTGGVPREYDAVVTFPVKHNWWEKADLELIRDSAERLRNSADAMGWKDIFVPLPGCGNGGLKWEQVRPVLEPHFDDRFKLVTFA